MFQRLVENDQQDEDGVDDRIGDDDVASDRLIDAIASDIRLLDDSSNIYPMVRLVDV